MIHIWLMLVVLAIALVIGFNTIYKLKNKDGRGLTTIVKCSVLTALLSVSVLFFMVMFFN